MEKYDINLSISIYGDDCYFEKINISEDEDIPHENCSSCSGHVAVYHKGMHKISVGGVTLDAKGNLYYFGFNEVYKFNDFFSTNYELIYGSDYINIYNVSSYSEILKMMQQENCHFSKYCKGREVFQWNVSECDISEWQK